LEEQGVAPQYEIGARWLHNFIMSGAVRSAKNTTLTEYRSHNGRQLEKGRGRTSSQDPRPSSRLGQSLRIRLDYVISRQLIALQWPSKWSCLLCLLWELESLQSFSHAKRENCGGNVKVGQECELWLCGLLKTHSCTTRQNGNMAKGQGAGSHLQVYDVVNQLGGGR